MTRQKWCIIQLSAEEYVEEIVKENNTEDNETKEVEKVVGEDE